MANNTIQVKRSSTAGRQPNTTNSANSQYINAGEFALNMADQILYTSDGTNLITVGANVVNQSVTGNLTVKAIVANNSLGTANQVLTTNGTGVYWSTVSGGGGGSVNVAAQYTWTNTQTFTNTITYSGNVVLQGSLSANGNVGSAGQVLSSNGSVVYWANSTGGGFTNGQSISVNNFSITGAFSANGANGTAGQILVSNSSGGPYWTSNFVVRQQFVANGTANTFTVTGGYSANNLDVYLNGVKLYNGTEANVSSGSTVTILGANPANGSLIEVVGTTQSASLSSTVVNQQITANGTANSFAVAGGYIPNGIQVYLNGVKQIPGVDVIISSGANVGFTVTPSNNHIIDIYGYQTAVASVVGGATGGGSDQVFFVSSQNVTSSYTIPTGKSAMTVGPTNLANGVTVTVPSGSRWVIL